MQGGSGIEFGSGHNHTTETISLRDIPYVPAVICIYIYIYDERVTNLFCIRTLHSSSLGVMLELMDISAAIEARRKYLQ